jgi:hypothetical protein
MKKLIMTVALLIMSYMAVFATEDEMSTIGWRKGVLMSYCDEYDVMLGESGQWIVQWGASREAIKGALIRDGFSPKETDSSIIWNQNLIYKCELQFNSEQRLKTIMYTVTLNKINTGIQISNSLKTKYVSLYGSEGKFKMIGESSSYSWLDNRCNRPIYALLANTVVTGGGYIVTVIASPLGK